MAGVGLNKVTLIGRLGADPERRRTQSGLVIANLSIATTESWFDKESRERKERTEWHRVVFFGTPAENILKYSQKGHQLFVEGRLQTRKWQDQSGQDRYTTEVIGRDFIFLSRNDGPASSGSTGSDELGSDDRERTSSMSSMDDDLDVDVPW